MANLEIKCIVVGMVRTNCYLISNTETKEAILVDPGASASEIQNLIKEEQVTVNGILLTHGHFDHIMAINELRNQLNVDVYAAEEEKELLFDASMNCSKDIGFEYIVQPDVCLVDGQVLNLAGTDIKVISTPGHTKGSVCYYIEQNGLLISGDTLFQESIGRTDLPTGSSAAIIRSVKEKLFVLNDDVMVLPGHGDHTTIGYEKANNMCI